MATFEVTACVSVEIKFFIAAESEESAKALFSDRLAVDAAMIDSPIDLCTPVDCSVDQIESLSAERVDLAHEPNSLIE